MSKFLTATLLLLCMVVFTAGAQKKSKTKELVWHTDVHKAREISAKTKKPIFAFFTGSDWCGWCRKLQNDVFQKDEFKEWAAKNVILLELDFPRRKQLAPELMQQNAELQQAFQVRGYPTIWIFNLSKGAQDKQFNIAALGSLGYPSGAEPGREEVKFLAEANKILNNK